VLKIRKENGMNRTQRAIKKQYRQSVLMAKRKKNEALLSDHSDDAKRFLAEEKENRRMVAEYKCRTRKEKKESAIA
jgi:hypothetical protein